MDSVYHIETDLKCKVLHYGKEVCVATPGEDVTINLRKGNHRLTFISSENSEDSYSIFQHVEENDMEDFISVNLMEIRLARLQREEAEQARRREDERIRQEAERARLIREQRIKEDEQRRINEIKCKRDNECRLLNEAMTNNKFPYWSYDCPFPIRFYMNPDSGQMLDERPKEYGYEEVIRYGLLKKKSIELFKQKSDRCLPCASDIKTWVTEPIRFLRKHGEHNFYFGRALCDIVYSKSAIRSLFKENRMFISDIKKLARIQQERYFIDQSMNKVIPIHKDYFASTFRLGVAFLVNGCSPPFWVKIIDVDGNEILRNRTDTLINEYVPRDDFPIDIRYGVNYSKIPYVAFCIKPEFRKKYWYSKDGWKHSLADYPDEYVYCTHEDVYTESEIKKGIFSGSEILASFQKSMRELRELKITI